MTVNVSECNCHNCSTYGTPICPDKESERDFPCLSHPRALETLITSVSTEDLVEALKKRDGVTVTKESPCHVTKDNPEGSCLFEDEYCEECKEKNSNAWRVVIETTPIKNGVKKND